MHPALIKAQKIASEAKSYDWHGSIDSEVVNGCRTTFLNAKRNDECIHMIWRNNEMIGATYSLFEHETELNCAATVLRHIEGWPDIVELLKRFNTETSGIEFLISRYRRLPFDPDSDDDEAILKCLAGRHIWWYSSLTGKIRDEWVMEPRRKSQVFNLRKVGIKKLFSFTTVDTGIRSIVLDTLLRVA